MDRRKRLNEIVERWKKHVIVTEKAKETGKEIEKKH